MGFSTRRIWRALVAGAVALSIGAGLTGHIVHAGARTGTVALTATHRDEPFTLRDKIAPGYTVLDWEKGSCWTESAASIRPGAFRCMVRNEILDPCFRNHAKTRVACPPATNPKRLIGIVLTKALPKRSKQGPEHVAWLLQTSSGVWCRIDTGATWAVDGKRANFGCTNGTWLYGRANAKVQPWTISKGKGPHSHLHLVAIRAAWF